MEVLRRRPTLRSATALRSHKAGRCGSSDGSKVVTPPDTAKGRPAAEHPREPALADVTGPPDGPSARASACVPARWRPRLRHSRRREQSAAAGTQDHFGPAAVAGAAQVPPPSAPRVISDSDVSGGTGRRPLVVGPTRAARVRTHRRSCSSGHRLVPAADGPSKAPLLAGPRKFCVCDGRQERADLARNALAACTSDRRVIRQLQAEDATLTASTPHPRRRRQACSGVWPPAAPTSRYSPR
ncbi:uncharacterized protein V1510DRAFT_106225 [Dipodascopsis tothii]|uniref:uncharacterized protein n=1 Tax=Dipodascopsis tothii TaxID=44089 RepID=UPI0034CD6379